jgi:hypothetical protein
MVERDQYVSPSRQLTEPRPKNIPEGEKSGEGHQQNRLTKNKWEGSVVRGKGSGRNASPIPPHSFRYPRRVVTLCLWKEKIDSNKRGLRHLHSFKRERERTRKCFLKRKSAALYDPTASCHSNRAQKMNSHPFNPPITIQSQTCIFTPDISKSRCPNLTISHRPSSSRHQHR